MNRYVLIYLFLLVITFMPVVRINAGQIPVPVKAELVSDVSAVKPGSSFNLGVLFEVEPGWHIYWKNPGDSGLPTTVDFNLPSGFEKEKTVWPLPTVFRWAGNIVDYGYEDSLLLTTRVNAPSRLASGSTVNISAKVSWVSCKEICIPGKKELTLELPVSITVKRADTDLFSEWNAKLPLNESEGRSTYNIEVETVQSGADESTVSISLDAVSGFENIDFYPVPPDSLIVENVKIAPDDMSGKAIITFDVKKLPGLQTSDNELDTLIVFTGSNGQRSGIELPVLLDKSD